MKRDSWAPFVFGLAAIVSGVVSLLWRGPSLPEHMQKLLVLPAGSVVVAVLACAFILGGALMLVPRSRRIAGAIVGIAACVLVLAALTGVVSHPNVVVEYENLAEQSAVALGAFACYRGSPRVLRIGMGLCAIVFAIAQIKYFAFTASLVPHWMIPGASFWTGLTTVAFALAGIAALTGVRAVAALRLMALMIVIFGIAIWIPTTVTHPTLDNWSELSVNFLIAAASALVAETLRSKRHIQAR